MSDEMHHRGENRFDCLFKWKERLKATHTHTHTDVHTYTYSTRAVKQPTHIELNTWLAYPQHKELSWPLYWERQWEEETLKEREDTLIDISSLKSLWRTSERERAVECIMQTGTFILMCHTKEMHVYLATATIYLLYKINSVPQRGRNRPGFNSIRLNIRKLTLTVWVMN